LPDSYIFLQEGGQLGSAQTTAKQDGYRRFEGHR
jgi:hypothetical protein